MGTLEPRYMGSEELILSVPKSTKFLDIFLQDPQFAPARRYVLVLESFFKLMRRGLNESDFYTMLNAMGLPLKKIRPNARELGKRYSPQQKSQMKAFLQRYLPPGTDPKTGWRGCYVCVDHIINQLKRSTLSPSDILEITKELNLLRELMEAVGWMYHVVCDT